MEGKKIDDKLFTENGTHQYIDDGLGKYVPTATTDELDSSKRSPDHPLPNPHALPDQEKPKAE